MDRALLKTAKTFVQGILGSDPTGHDWEHANRVMEMASLLALEHANTASLDLTVIQLAALIHDVPDSKLTDDVEGRYAQVEVFLSGLEVVTPEQALHIIDIARTMSWSAGKVMKTVEGEIVQDADRLDALGAIGIARCFAYGGSKGKLIYNPKDMVGHLTRRTDKEYKTSDKSSVFHFYEKLLGIQGSINTPAAKKIAIRRTKVLEEFLDQFFKEWNLCD